MGKQHEKNAGNLGRTWEKIGFVAGNIGGFEDLGNKVNLIMNWNLVKNKFTNFKQKHVGVS